jgi:hypothetical protein
LREGAAAESVGAGEGGGGRSTAEVEAAAVVAGGRAAADVYNVIFHLFLISS